MPPGYIHGTYPEDRLTIENKIKVPNSARKPPPSLDAILAYVRRTPAPAPGSSEVFAFWLLDAFRALSTPPLNQSTPPSTFKESR